MGMLEKLNTLARDRLFNELDNALTRFNLFEAVGMTHQEIRHSQTLSFLFDPNSPHGLGVRPLQLFLKLAALHRETLESEVCFEGAYVLTEYRNIDLLIVLPVERQLVLVENKVWANERDNQLSDYQNLIASDPQFQGWQSSGVFLSPTGRSGSTDLGDGYWQSCSYEQIVELLKQLSPQDPEVALLVLHYQRMLEKHIMGNPDLRKQAQILYEAHKDAFDFVFANRPKGGFERAKEHLAEQLDVSELFERVGGLGGILRFKPSRWLRSTNLPRNAGWDGNFILFELSQSKNGLKFELVVDREACDKADKSSVSCALVRDGLIVEGGGYPRISQATRQFSTVENRNAEQFEIDLLNWIEQDVLTSAQEMSLIVDPYLGSADSAPGAESLETQNG